MNRPARFPHSRIRLAVSTLVAVIASISSAALPEAADSVSLVRSPPVQDRSTVYLTSREPLLPSPLIRLPIGSIRPNGWLLEMLLLEKEGMHGHLDELSPYLDAERSAWLDREGRGSAGWEELPYWLKGFGALAYVLHDDELAARAKAWIDGIIGSQKPDGWFGPDDGRTGQATRLEGRSDLWPNMIALFCLQDWHEYSGDPRVIELMTRYFRYLATVPEDAFLVGYWPRMRGGDLLSSIQWLYDRTGDRFLLELAGKVHRRTAAWESGVIDWHNVNISQAFGEAATWFRQSHEPVHLLAAYENYDTIRSSYGQVPGGMFGGDENSRPGFTGPRQAVETCGMVEMMLSTETLAWITGDPLWADRAEDVAFNSLPAALTPDLKALRYLTAPNLVLSDRASKSPGYQNSGPMLLMSPHIHRCCQHNWGHGWPYFAAHLWCATQDEGLAALLYSSSEVKAKVRGGVEVTIVEETRYPFSGEVRFVVRPDETARFPIYLRVPGWCAGARLTVAGNAVDLAPRPHDWVRIEREWQAGDELAIRLPMAVRIRRWPENFHSISVDRGPLTYSLEIGESWKRAGGSDRWPEWEIHPTSAWNYGLIVDESDPASSFEVVEGKWPDDDAPFTHEGTPVRLRAKGKKIPAWKLDDLGLASELQESPVRSEEPLEDLALIPMGAARLRISSFPVIGEGPGAHEWKAPPEPAFRSSASQTWDGDTVRAIADRIEPASSNDHSIPRHTFWPHRGTREWLEAHFDEPRTVESVALYWFDDTGRGACRVPASWKLFYRDGDRWEPVEGASEYGVERDRFNETKFEAVETDALRIEVELRDNFSAGVLEWRVGEDELKR